MKYLKLHIFIVWLLVLLYTIIDAIMWSIGYIIAFLWTFDYIPISKAWKIGHTYIDEFSPRKNPFYEDKNIIDSFNRRWAEIKDIINK